MLLQFAKLDEVPEDDRDLRGALLAAAIEWHKMPIHPTVAEAMLLEPLEREILAYAFDIVHGYKIHPDYLLAKAVSAHAADLAGVT